MACLPRQVANHCEKLLQVAEIAANCVDCHAATVAFSFRQRSWIWVLAPFPFHMSKDNWQGELQVIFGGGGGNLVVFFC